MKVRKDLSGQVFARLTVVCMSSPGPRSRSRWVCRCECGIEMVAEGSNLATGNTKSCGCLKRDVTAKNSTRHGYARSGNRAPEYEIWGAMIQRCRNPNNQNFYRYGGRGIQVCERWLQFENFIADMGHRPSADLTIERIRNNEGYGPGNCLWATMSEQNRNTRKNRYFETPAGRLPLWEASEISGIPAAVLWKRARRGWAAHRMFDPLGTYTVSRQGIPLPDPARTIS